MPRRNRKIYGLRSPHASTVGPIQEAMYSSIFFATEMQSVAALVIGGLKELYAC